MPLPIATYRLQFRPSFGFDHATRLIPYLHGLGISHVYASPLFQARSGSEHGYDITDPNRLDTRLGDETNFRDMVAALHAHGMKLILDIVPNHQAASHENPAWYSLLQHGRSSPFAHWFDVDWDADPGGKLRLPMLGAHPDDAISHGDLRLVMGPDGLSLRYFDTPFPLAPPAWAFVVESNRTGEPPPLLAALAAGLRHASPDAALRLQDDFASAYTREPRVATFIDAAVARFTPHSPAAHHLFDELLARQHYRLLYWRTGIQTVNYRRFFDISDLAAVRQEDPRVFEETHALVRTLLRDRAVHGLRVDHIDGLRDPAAYLERLRALFPEGEESYILVEKILGAGESLPPWPVAGTTGYDFLNDVLGTMVDARGLARHAARYETFTGDAMGPIDRAHQQKREALLTLFNAEIDALTRHLATIAASVAPAAGIPESALRAALVELTACMPVYRTYATALPLQGQDLAMFATAMRDARQRAPAVPPAAFDLLDRIAGGDAPSHANPLDWLLSWQQLTGPAMAKGYEDTTLYRYVPLVAVNVVGSEPESLEHPHDIAAFHASMTRRAADWPGTLNATSTHDAKRGEDTRARLAVLSEMPGEWWDHVERWADLTAPFRITSAGTDAPSPRDVVLFFQTIVGAWPPGMDLPNDDFRNRIDAYMRKAAREAGARTSWLDPDDAYETALSDFVSASLDRARSRALLDEVRELVATLAFHGALNSLAQLTLKLVCPGIPDFYQGAELWDLSLVDPDNRRPVDFSQRIAALDELQAVPPDSHAHLASALLASWQDGRVKLFVTERGLALRHREPDLFDRGDYHPVEVTGARPRHAVAAVRHLGDAWATVIVPRLTAGLTAAAGMPPHGDDAWFDTAVLLPSDAPHGWRNAFTGDLVDARREDAHGLRIPVADALRLFPVAILTPAH